MMKPITQEPGSLLASPDPSGLADRCRTLSCLLSQIGWVWIPWRWQGALSKNSPGLISSPTWPIAFSLTLYPGYLSFPAGRGTSQRQGKSIWWSGHNPPRGDQGEEFTTTLTLRFGRQMTSVSDKWECQVISAWWGYSSEDHKESIPLEEEKNSWHRNPAGPFAEGNTGSQAGRFQVMPGWVRGNWHVKQAQDTVVMGPGQVRKVHRRKQDWWLRGTSFGVSSVCPDTAKERLEEFGLPKGSSRKTEGTRDRQEKTLGHFPQSQNLRSPESQNSRWTIFQGNILIYKNQN